MLLMMNWEELQDELRRLIRARRGSQAEIARQLEISRAAVAEYVMGGRNIPTGHISVILKVLGMTLELRDKSSDGEPDSH